MKEQIKKICENLIKEKDTKKALSLINDLKKALEKYKAELIQGEGSRRFVLLKGEKAVPYDTALLTLIYMAMYKHSTKGSTVEISYNRIAESVGIGHQSVSNRVALLARIGVVKKVGLSETHTNKYKVKELFQEKLAKSEIVTDIHDLKEVTPKYLKAFTKAAEKIKERLAEKVEKYTYVKPKGLVPVGGILIPHSMLRPVLIFITLYLHKDKEGTAYLSNNTLSAYTGIGAETLRKEVALLSSLGWIEIEDRKPIGTYKVRKDVKGLEHVYKNTAILNIRDFYIKTPDERYKEAVISLCEELSGISLKIKEGKK